MTIYNNEMNGNHQLRYTKAYNKRAFSVWALPRPGKQDYTSTSSPELFPCKLRGARLDCNEVGMERKAKHSIRSLTLLPMFSLLHT